MNGRLLVIGLAAVGILAYVSQLNAKPSGVWIEEASSDPNAPWPQIIYQGPSLPVDQAIASIADKFVIMWHWSDAGGWASYGGADWGGPSSLIMVQNGEEYFIKVTERCFWSW